MSQLSAVPRPRPRPGDGGNLLMVSVSVRKSYTLVSLNGEGDVTVRERLRAALTPAATGTRQLVVDLSGLSYLDVSCLQVLVGLSLMVQEAGGELRLAAPRPLVARVMEVCGTGQVLGVHDSLATAVSAAAG
jgi:anti-sigma B factor antagonist